jgi:S1-C subfamily serine protease
LFHAFALFLAILNPAQVIQVAESSAVYLTGTDHEVNSEAWQQMQQAPPIEDDNDAQCSGMVAATLKNGDQFIITAKHCNTTISTTMDGVEMYTTERLMAEVHYQDGEAAKVVWLWNDPVNDISIVRVHPIHPHHLVSFDLITVLSPGMPLFDIGSPSGEYFSFGQAYSARGSHLTRVEISDTKGLVEPAVYTIDCPMCQAGSSGSPIFTVDGGVVAMFVAGTDETAITYAVPAEYLFQALLAADAANARPS